MRLCGYNPQLLNYDLASTLITNQCRMKSIRGYTALIFLLRSDSAYLVNFESNNFRALFNAEFEVRDVLGWTALMHLCYTSPFLLKSYFWFIEPLLQQASVITKRKDTAISCFIGNIK